MSLLFRYKRLAAPESVFNRSVSCDISWPGYVTLSDEELQFPLAYIITAFQDPRNLELTLATIFRPHNSYCINIDPKSDFWFSESVKNILRCYKTRYPDTYISSSSRPVSVFWGHFSIVEAELNCMRDLLDNNLTWSYALDMAGSEVMMMTNKELVANISSYPDKIFTESFPLPKVNMLRIKYKYSYETPGKASKKIGLNDPPPFNLKIHKGAKAWTAPRRFIEFLVHHPVATTYLNWAKHTFVSDEHVIPTLARISETVNTGDQWSVRQDNVPEPRYHFQLWWTNCRGVKRHGVCVFSLEDLSTIVKADCIRINKVISHLDPVIAECLRDAVRSREVIEL